MRRLSSLRQLAIASVILTILTIGVSAQPTPTPTPTFKLHLANSEFDPNSTTLPKPLPVLFVHGHNLLDPEDDPPNFRNNWQSGFALGGDDLPSFQHALQHPQNDSLGIEEYYIQFLDQGRSIHQDALDIGAAVEIILHRHDSQYPGRPTSVQVVIIAYSKGTISTRLYLKNLAAEGRSFNPISEFIAISPPNHGLNSENGGSTCAGRQLMNGMQANCTEFADPAGTGADCAPFPNDALGFFRVLNGHPADDSMRLDGPDSLGAEAPNSRTAAAPSGTPTPPSAGTLYVTMFDNDDFVGGDQPSSDCHGRKLAKNLSPNAVNLPITVPGLSVLVHQRTVHTQEVICKALHAAVHHRSPENAICGSATTTVNGQSISIPLIDPPTRAAAMLTLDFSGSMLVPACSNCGTRAEVLKDAVELFVQLWSAVGVPSDRLGVNYFRTSVQQFQFGNNNQTLPNLLEAAPSIIADVNNQAPGGRTAMGLGLQSAINDLNAVPNTPIRRVILFTDGMQNVNPLARVTNGQLVIGNQPVPSASPAVVVDTIGIGEAPVALLQDIAAATGGRTWLTSAPNDDLRLFFIEQLINGLRGFSPQLVDYRQEVVSAGGANTESFPIEGGLRKLVLKVSWKRGDSVDFTVAKNGVDVTSAGRFVSGAFYKIFVIDFPARGKITSRGNWQVRIKGKRGVRYEAAAIVDGSQITYDAIFRTKSAKAGNPLDLAVPFAIDKKAFSGNPTITVTLRSPKIAVGDISSKIQPKNLPDFEPGMSLSERQLLALTLEREKWPALKPKLQTMLLRPKGKDDFSLRLHPQIPGIYTALVTISGDSRMGKFNRTMTVTTLVRR